MPQLSCPNLSELARGVNKSGNGEVGEPESVLLAGVNPAWLDVAFTDRPISCDQDNGTCDEMERLWVFQEIQGRHEEKQYKFILNVSVEFRVRRYARRVCARLTETGGRVASNAS